MYSQDPLQLLQRVFNVGRPFSTAAYILLPNFFFLPTVASQHHLADKTVLTEDGFGSSLSNKLETAAIQTCLGFGYS